MRPCERQLHFYVRRNRLARDLPIARQLEPRILDRTHDFWNFNSKAQWSITPILHFLEADAVYTLLEKVVHVFAAAFAVTNDIQAGFGLISGRPANDIVGFLPG